MNNTKQKKRLGALDFFIIFAIIAVIMCFAVRYIATERSDVSEKVELEEYTVTFKVSNIKDSSAKNYFIPGSKFYMKDTNAYFGELREGLTIKDAEKTYEMPNGEVVIGENNSVGDLYKVDVEASVTAKGKTDSNGAFLLNGNTYIGVNKTFIINSKYLSVEVLITDITKS